MKQSQTPSQPDAVAGLASMIFQGGAFISWTLGAWSLTSALHITESFAVSGGVFSSWIAWIVLGLALRVLGKHVERELSEHPWRFAALGRVLAPAQARRSRSIPPDDRTAAAA